MHLNTYCILCSECIKGCPNDNVAINFRPFAVDLGKTTKQRTDEAYLTLIMLGLASFHGLSMTPVWTRIVAGIQGYLEWRELAAFSLGMAAIIVLTIALYGLFSWITQSFAEPICVPSSSIWSSGSSCFVARMGRINTIVFPAILALPFMAVLPLAPTFLLAGLLYLLNGIIGSVSGPIQSLFTMELVGQKERGTVEGVLHAVSELPMGMTSLIAGPLMLSNMWGTQFGWAAILMLASLVLFFIFFRSVDKRQA